MTQAGPGGVAGRATAPALLPVTLCAVQFVGAYDIAAIGPALPKIQSDLDMTPEAPQWVVTAYVLGYGEFLLVGGRLADLFNRNQKRRPSMRRRPGREIHPVAPGARRAPDRPSPQERGPALTRAVDPPGTPRSSDWRPGSCSVAVC